jgi:hypothetical protein
MQQLHARIACGLTGPAWRPWCGCRAAGAALYTAYRDSDTLLNSKDIVSGMVDIMRRGSATGNLEVGSVRPGARAGRAGRHARAHAARQRACARTHTSDVRV